MLRIAVITSASVIAAVLALGPALAEGPFGGIQKGDNPKHTPVIEAPDAVQAGEPFLVTVRVGKTMHPSETGHFVRFIELYAGDVQLARASLTPTMTQPVVTFTVMLPETTTLRARMAPNHSAAWETTKKITVKPGMKKEMKK
jgi:superoxide reductase